jgi:hypothetical protein
MYTNWYDLIAHPEHVQPPYLLYAFWFLVLATLVGLGVHLARMPGLRGKMFCVIAVLILGVETVGAFYDYARYGDLKAIIAERRYQTVEGCLDSFHAGQWMGGRRRVSHEFWRVGGHEFEYSSGAIGQPGYHAAASGAPDATSRVRVAFVTMPTWGRIILRLETIRGVCPAAPDLEFGGRR